MLGLGLLQHGALQRFLVGEIVQRRAGAGHRRFRAADRGLVVGGIDLDERLAGLYRLEVIDQDAQHIAADARTERRDVGMDIGVVGRLDRRGAHPVVPMIVGDDNQADHRGDRHCRDSKSADAGRQRKRRFAGGRRRNILVVDSLSGGHDLLAPEVSFGFFWMRSSWAWRR